MTDEIPNPDATPNAEPSETGAAAPVGAAEPPVDRSRPATSRWWNRRVPLFVIAAALVLGCMLGGAAVAVGALVVGAGHRGDDREHSRRDVRPDGLRGPDWNRGYGRRPRNGPDQPAPVPSTSAASPGTAVPGPSPSGLPSATPAPTAS